ncbi:MAG: hypothetical protein HKM04_09500 [Legionellales bacterium]|nr:hypothetical protein [Legionellales bacterium]
MSRQNDYRRFKETEIELERARFQLEKNGECQLYSRNELEKSNTPPPVLARLVEASQINENRAFFPPIRDADPLKTEHPENLTRGWLFDAKQLENGDSDPRLLSSAIGVDYKSNSQYELVLITPPATMQIVAANSNGIAKIGGTYLSGKETTYQEALKPEVQTKYKELIESEQLKRQAAGESPFKIGDNQERMAFSETAGQDCSQFTPTQLIARTELHRSLGANEHYSGHGMTKTNPDVKGIDVGAHNLLTSNEYIAIDSKPHTLNELKEQGLAISLPCKEIQRDITLTSPDRESYNEKMSAWKQNPDAEFQANNIHTSTEFSNLLNKSDQNHATELREKYDGQLNEIKTSLQSDDIYSTDLANKENISQELENRIAEIDHRYPPKEHTEAQKDEQNKEQTETKTNEQKQEQTETQTDKQNQEQIETQNNKQNQEETETQTDKQNQEQIETQTDEQHQEQIEAQTDQQNQEQTETQTDEQAKHSEAPETKPSESAITEMSTDTDSESSNNRWANMLATNDSPPSAHQKETEHVNEQ